MRLRIEQKKIWNRYIEIRLIPIQDWYYIQVLTSDYKDWKHLTYVNNKRVMVRHIIGAINILALCGWEFVEYTAKYKGNNARILLKKIT